MIFDWPSLPPSLSQYDYSFRTEHSAAARLPPSPTRTSLSSEAWGPPPIPSLTTLSRMDASRRDPYTTTEDLPTTNSPKHLYWEEKTQEKIFCGFGSNHYVRHWWAGLIEGILKYISFPKHPCVSVVPCSPNDPSPSKGLDTNKTKWLKGDGGHLLGLIIFAFLVHDLAAALSLVWIETPGEHIISVHMLKIQKENVMSWDSFSILYWS